MSSTTHHPVGHPVGHGTLRLTRRGRLVVLLTLVTLVLGAFSLGRVGTEAAPSAPLTQTVVHEGESLWAVAKRVAPGRDPRSTMDRIVRLNGLDGGAVYAGQLLVLPR